MMNHHSLLCSPTVHLSRRTLLGAGGGGLMLSSLARSLARADELGITDSAKPRSVILLWMEGGPSQLETFDPHAGTKYGGEVSAIETSVKGVQFSDLMPQTAQQMHLVSLVRSVTSKEGDHERAVYNVKSGFRPDPTLQHPSIGAILCQQDPQASDIPRHVSILPGKWPAKGGYLGPHFDAFKMNDPDQPVPDVKSAVKDKRFRRRIDDLYQIVEAEFQRGRLVDLERQRTLHQAATDSAVRMMSSEQLDAFDISSETKATREAFGDTRFGRGCLAASRLIEVGVRCVEVTLSGWDSHAANQLRQTQACGKLDPALAALLTRLKERDLLDSTLVVCGGEFGRTPKINPAQGRDHHPHGFSVMLAGAGIRRGVVHGETAAEPKLDPDKPLNDVKDPVTIADLHATILSALKVDHEHEQITPIGRPMKRSEGSPIGSILTG